MEGLLPLRLPQRGMAHGVLRGDTWRPAEEGGRVPSGIGGQRGARAYGYTGRASRGSYCRRDNGRGCRSCNYAILEMKRFLFWH